jgi:hypothetical protein
MPTKDMKATQTNRMTLELLALVMISGLMLLAVAKPEAHEPRVQDGPTNL